MRALSLLGLGSRLAFGAAFEPSRIVLKDHAFEQGAHDLLILGPHAGDGLEVQA